MEIRADEHETHIRRSRIMISKIPASYSSSEDSEFVNALANFLGINPSDYSVRKIIRVKHKADPHDPFLLVEFNHESNKFLFLNKQCWEKLSKVSPEQDFHGIIINQDRTQKERDDYKRQKNLADAKNQELAWTGDRDHKYVVKGLRLVKIEISAA